MIFYNAGAVLGAEPLCHGTSLTLIMILTIFYILLSIYKQYIPHNIQGVKKCLQRFRDDRGGKNKHVFYLAKLWLMQRFAARWTYG